MVQKAADQITLVDLTDAYSVILTSEASTIPGTTTNAIQTSVTTQVVAMRGDEQMTATVTAANVLTPSGVTAAVNANSGSPIVTITVGTSVTSSGTVRIPVVIGDITIMKDFSFSLALRGATGDTGAPGRGITSTAVTYQQSTSGTTAPTGTWTTTVPTVTAGNFLWTRTIMTYTDASTSTLYAVGRSGTNGAQGNPGNPGTNGQTSYFHVAYATNATGTTGFSTTDPTGKTYIGTYTDFTAADSTDPSLYEWVLIKGADGGTGAPGKGISGTVVTYQGHTSGTATPTGTWSATIPAVADGQFLWTRTVITFSDGATQTSYAVAKQGEKGTTGDPGAPGADAITLSVTSSAGLIFKNSDIVTTLTATVYRAGVELTPAQVAALGTVKWYKDGNSTSVASGLTLSITAGQVTNRATYMALLEN